MAGHLEPERTFSDKEQRFIDEYCVDLATRAAAIRAGCAPSTASSWGNERLRRPEIRKEIDDRLQEMSERSIVSAEWVRRQLKTVVERAMQHVPVLISQVNPETKKREMVESGEYKFDSNGANKALELLGKHLGMFKDTTVITIESELKDMTPEQLAYKKQAILEEHATLDLVMNAQGVFEEAHADPDIQPDTPTPPAPDTDPDIHPDTDPDAAPE